MRLRMLAKLEHIKIEQELAERRKEQKGLEKILSSKTALNELVINEIQADAKTFGDARRTKIEAAEKAEIETPVVDEPVTVIFSKNGWVRARQGHGIDTASLSFKEGDALAAAIECRTVDPVIFLDSKGRAYTAQAGELPPARGDGAPASSLVDVQDGARVMHCLAGPPDSTVLVASSGGYGFVSRLSDMVSNRRAGREFMSIRDTDVPVAPVLFKAQAGSLVVAASAQGKMLAFGLDEVGYLARGRGVILMGLDADDRLALVAVATAAEITVSGTSRGKPKELRLAGAAFQHYVGHRALKGRVLPDKLIPHVLRPA